jgi:hypothetical protein
MELSAAEPNEHTGSVKKMTRPRDDATLTQVPVTLLPENSVATLEAVKEQARLVSELRLLALLGRPQVRKLLLRPGGPRARQHGGSQKGDTAEDYADTVSKFEPNDHRETDLHYEGLSGLWKPTRASDNAFWE